MIAGIQDIDKTNYYNKVVFMRCDFNVPTQKISATDQIHGHRDPAHRRGFHSMYSIVNDAKIRAAMDSINYVRWASVHA